MIRTKYTSFFTAIALLFFSSCEKEVELPPMPKEEFSDIVGSVNLYDEGPHSIGDAGMTVYVEGSDPLISDVSDMDGNFVLEDVPFGMVNIIYEKDGYGTHKKIGLEHKYSGANTIISNSPFLGRLSTTEITELSTEIDYPKISIRTTTSPSATVANTRYIRLFYSPYSGVTKDIYSVETGIVEAQSNPHEINLYVNDLYEQGYSSGDRFYIKAYGESFQSNEYYDPSIGRLVFPNINENTVPETFFVVP